MQKMSTSVADLSPNYAKRLDAKNQANCALRLLMQLQKARKHTLSSVNKAVQSAVNLDNPQDREKEKACIMLHKLGSKFAYL